MSRDLTAAAITEATGIVTRPVLLMQYMLDSGTLRFWNGEGDFVYDSNTYTGAGHLLKISEIDETQKTEARGITLTLSGVPSALISVVNSEEYQDRQVTIDLAFLDADGVVIADPYRYFSGKADVMSMTTGGSTATISLTAENDMIAFKKINERRRTPEDQRLSYSGDTFFDNVAALQSKEILWGGK